ncbi:TetR/AcrR family transcriptional regulator [Ktedonospora formicarum]|uniref:TetR family transcriptional regulator n=1 Tax=Ktedonospora formicarum TaxID=2778364 RepID=A0A8J3I9D2_9CHLR|nr:TetR family transcriptional regulator [Ktedonospora formicarum]GHO47869.1 TetR family transcriptional regulator [Ktedonospora formicarum]
MAVLEEREARAHRILDAAAELILRWGFQKTTLDDISRLAGVAKSTMYLHWKTREELFKALLRRERVGLAEDIERGIASDPLGVTLGGILRHCALATLKRPLMKAILLRDMDVLGKLAHREQHTPMNVSRLLGFKHYIAFLREHGLARTDMSLEEQVVVFSSIFMGFFITTPLLPDEFAPADEKMAALMAETAHRTLEPAEPISPDKLQTVSEAFTLFLSQAIEAVREQFQKSL